MVFDAQRQNARCGIDKYKVTTVDRPPLHITKECVIQRVRARVAEKRCGFQSSTYSYMESSLPG